MPALSEHLFRDVDRSSIDPEKHAPWLVKRDPASKVVVANELVREPMVMEGV